MISFISYDNPWKWALLLFYIWEQIRQPEALGSVSTKPGSSCWAAWLSSSQPELHSRITREDCKVLSDQASLLRNSGLIGQKWSIAIDPFCVPQLILMAARLSTDRGQASSKLVLNLNQDDPSLTAANQFSAECMQDTIGPLEICWAGMYAGSLCSPLLARLTDLCRENIFREGRGVGGVWRDDGKVQMVCWREEK